jgi:hypothetical protein
MGLVSGEGILRIFPRDSRDWFVAHDLLQERLSRWPWSFVAIAGVNGGLERARPLARRRSKQRPYTGRLAGALLAAPGLHHYRALGNLHYGGELKHNRGQQPTPLTWPLLHAEHTKSQSTEPTERADIRKPERRSAATK